MIQITHPVQNEVVQRANNNVGYVLVEGTCSDTVTRIVVEFTPVADDTITGAQGTRSGRMVIVPSAGGQFSGRVPVRGGWYDLKATAYVGATEGVSAFVSPVGVGEVFVVFGHSVPAGDGTAWVGATDKRVVAPSQVDTDNATVDFAFGHLADYAPRGPFNNMPGAHGLVGDLLVARLNVPIAFYGASFGGSNMEQNDMQIRRIPFQHTFVKYDDGMPYEPLRRSLADFCTKTGVRAIISQQGINDHYRPEEQFFQEYKRVIEYSRASFDSKLPWIVILDDDATTGTDPQRAAIRRLWNLPDVYPGFDFREVTNIIADPNDKFHPRLETEWQLYARLLNAAISDDFLNRSAPVLIKDVVPVATPETPTGVAVVQPEVRKGSLFPKLNLKEIIPEEIRQDWVEISTPTKIIVGVIVLILFVALIIESND